MAATEHTNGDGIEMPSPRANRLRAERARHALDAYRDVAAPIDGDVEELVTDLLTDVFHAIGDAGRAAAVVQRSFGHFVYETGSDRTVAAFVDLLARTADYLDWVADTRDEHGDLRAGLRQSDWDEARSGHWEEIANAAVGILGELVASETTFFETLAPMVVGSDG